MSRPHYSLRVAELRKPTRRPVTDQLQAIVYLSIMWIAIFAFAAAAWTLFGGMLSTQIAVTLGVTMTGFAFLWADLRNHDALEQELMRAAHRR